MLSRGPGQRGMIDVRRAWLLALLALAALAFLRVWTRWGPVAAAIVLPAAVAVGAGAGLLLARKSRSGSR